MGDYLANLGWWDVVGWTGQGLYFGRFLIQWLASERAGRIVVPVAFWWMSLAGSACAASYAFVRHDPFFMAGPAVNFFLFARNLQLRRTRRPLGERMVTPLALGVATVALLLTFRDWDLAQPLPWLLIGGVGTVLWTVRFPVQWWCAERSNEATLPTAFFWISFVGSVLLLGYALRTGEPVFIAGMIPGPLLYGRSLWLCHRQPQGQG